MTNHTTEKISKALTEQSEPQQGVTLKALLSSESVKSRFTEVLGGKANGFISSVLSAVSTNNALKLCDPMSVVSAAAVAASLDLPINPSLGFAYIVPYKGKAQFQIGARGFVQLAMRTGQYQTMNVAEVYEGQLVKADPFTGVMEFKAEGKKSDKVIGYVAFFKLLNGFEKYAYASVEDITAHARKYSQSFDNPKGQWKQNFPAMAKKTVIKLLLSKWGIMSIDMQKAVQVDQAAINEKDEPEYIDAKTAEAAFEQPFDGEVVEEGAK